VKASLIPPMAGAIVFLSGFNFLKIGLSVAIVKIVLGAAAGNLGLKPEDWMPCLAGFGGIILTFLAGTEIATRFPFYKRRI